MLKIAAENNLSETAFFVKKDDYYEIRWFTPTVEINLCGHATLAASFVIFNCLNWEDKQVKFHSARSGDLSVEKQDERFVLDFPKYGLTEIEMMPELAAAVGKTPQRMWETQGNMAMLLFETEADVKALQPDMSALSRIDFDEFIVTAKGENCGFRLASFRAAHRHSGRPRNGRDALQFDSVLGGKTRQRKALRATAFKARR